jgi:Ca2+/Na+ antiporter
MIVIYISDEFIQHDEMIELPRIRKLAVMLDSPTTNQVIEVSVSRPLSSRIKHWLFLPIIILFKFTIPNPIKYERLAWLSVFQCSIWIGLLSYILVWWSHSLGVALEISDSILGITILAGGVSIPDLINALTFSYEGHRDMALSGTLGSNIINIGIALGLPYFIHGLYAGPFVMIGKGVPASEILLIALMSLSYSFVGGFKWELSKQLGGVIFIFYFLFVVLFIIFEFTI